MTLTLTLRVLYLGFLPLSGTNPSISRSVVSSILVRAWVVLFVSLAMSVTVGASLCPRRSVLLFRVMSTGCTCKSVICLIRFRLSVAGSGPGCLGGVVS